MWEQGENMKMALNLDMTHSGLEERHIQSCARGGRGGRGQFGQGRGGGQRLGTRRVVSGEIRATIIDHVINHGLTM